MKPKYRFHIRRKHSPLALQPVAYWAYEGAWWKVCLVTCEIIEPDAWLVMESDWIPDDEGTWWHEGLDHTNDELRWNADMTPPTPFAQRWVGLPPDPFPSQPTLHTAQDYLEHAFRSLDLPTPPTPP